MAFEGNKIIVSEVIYLKMRRERERERDLTGPGLSAQTRAPKRLLPIRSKLVNCLFDYLN